MQRTRRAFWIRIVIGFMFVMLCGCKGTHSMIDQRLSILDNDPYKDIPDQRIDFFADAVTDADASAIYEMFSADAKENGISDDSLDALISLLQPSIASLFNKRSLGEDVENKYGKKTITIIYAANIIINEIEYKITFGECVRDDNDADNVGLTQIVVFPIGSGASLPDLAETGIYVFN